MKVKPLDYIVKQKILGSFIEKTISGKNYQTFCFRIAVIQYHLPGQNQQIHSVAERKPGNLSVMHSGKTNYVALCSPTYRDKTQAKKCDLDHFP